MMHNVVVIIPVIKSIRKSLKNKCIFREPAMVTIVTVFGDEPFKCYLCHNNNLRTSFTVCCGIGFNAKGVIQRLV